MATFIPNITDYIPQYQPDIPNLGLIQQTLRTKQAQYDTNYAQWKRIQDNILQAPLSREDNMQERDQYMKAADNAIKRVSASDLSKPQNLAVAERIFEPIVNDPFIVKDMVFTRQYQKEYQNALDSRECTDPKKCPGRFNPEGIEGLQYQLEDFKKMSREESLKAGAVRYVADPDVAKKLTEYVKEIAPDAEIQEVGNQWMVTTKMGARVQGELSSMLTSLIANDPAVIDYMRNKAYVMRRREESSSGLDRKTADATYNNKFLTSIETELQERIKRNDNDLSTINDQIKNLEIKLGKKITEANKNAPAIGQIAELKKYAELYKSNGDYLQNQIGQLQNLKENPSSNQIDGLVAQSLLSTTIDTFAKTYSKLKEKVSYQINPVYEAHLKHSLAVDLERIRNANTLRQIEFKDYLDRQKELREAGQNGISDPAATLTEAGGPAATEEEIQPSTYVTEKAVETMNATRDTQKAYIRGVYEGLTTEQKKQYFSDYPEFADLEKLDINNPQHNKKVQDLYYKIKGYVNSNAILLTPDKTKHLKQQEQQIQLGLQTTTNLLSVLKKNAQATQKELLEDSYFINFANKYSTLIPKYFNVTEDSNGKSVLFLKKESEIPDVKTTDNYVSNPTEPTIIYIKDPVYAKLKKAYGAAQLRAEGKGTISYPKIGNLDSAPGGEYKLSYQGYGYTTPVSSATNKQAIAEIQKVIGNMYNDIAAGDGNVEIVIGDNTFSKEDTQNILSHINAKLATRPLSKTDQGFTVNNFVKYFNMGKDNEINKDVNMYRLNLPPEEVEEIVSLLDLTNSQVISNLGNGIKIFVKKGHDAKSGSEKFMDKNGFDKVKYLLNNRERVAYEAHSDIDRDINYGFVIESINNNYFLHLTQNGNVMPNSNQPLNPDQDFSAVYDMGVEHVNEIIQKLEQNKLYESNSLPAIQYFN